MGATHSKQRSEMSHELVFAHMVMGFNGPNVTEFAANGCSSELREKCLIGLYTFTLITIMIKLCECVVDNIQYNIQRVASLMT
jgi:hypothetical protein